jgi:hypothetical protein
MQIPPSAQAINCSDVLVKYLSVLDNASYQQASALVPTKTFLFHHRDVAIEEVGVDYGLFGVDVFEKSTDQVHHFRSIIQCSMGRGYMCAAKMWGDVHRSTAWVSIQPYRIGLVVHINN